MKIYKILILFSAASIAVVWLLIFYDYRKVRACNKIEEPFKIGEFSDVFDSPMDGFASGNVLAFKSGVFQSGPMRLHLSADKKTVEAIQCDEDLEVKSLTNK